MGYLNVFIYLFILIWKEFIFLFYLQGELTILETKKHY